MRWRCIDYFAGGAERIILVLFQAPVLKRDLLVTVLNDAASKHQALNPKP